VRDHRLLVEILTHDHLQIGDLRVGRFHDISDASRSVIDLVVRPEWRTHHLPKSGNDLARERVEIQRRVGHSQTVQNGP